MTQAQEIKKVGIYGGTFDPVHVGHIKAAEEIKRILELERIIFIPSFIPPHKNPTDTTPPEHRLKMLELALEAFPYFEISTYELDKKGTSYTIDTLRHLCAADTETEFYFILGSELFETIDSWKNYNDLFVLANFAVIERPGFYKEGTPTLPLAIKDDFRYYNSQDDVIIFKNENLREVAYIHIQGLRVSSTEIRDRIRADKTISDLVPQKVESYIHAHKLYSEVSD